LAPTLVIDVEICLLILSSSRSSAFIIAFAVPPYCTARAKPSRIVGTCTERPQTNGLVVIWKNRRIWRRTFVVRLTSSLRHRVELSSLCRINAAFRSDLERRIYAAAKKFDLRPLQVEEW